MDTAPLARPKAALHTQASFESSEKEHLDISHLPPSSQEFDPCSNAKPCSPFYLYNHDSPRPSSDVRPKNLSPAIHVAVQDLESGNLTPSISQEKQGAQAQRSGSDNGVLRLWQGRGGSKSNCSLLTKPKKQKWLATLPKWQRVLIKLVIAMLLVGAIVGLAVGISIKVHGGVYKNTNQTTQIGS